jgi:hypothetical protein
MGRLPVMQNDVSRDKWGRDHDTFFHHTGVLDPRVNSRAGARMNAKGHEYPPASLREALRAGAEAGGGFALPIRVRSRPFAV